MNPLEGCARLDHILRKNAKQRGVDAQAGGGLAPRMPEDGRSPPAAGSAVVIREALPTDIDALAQLEADRFASDRLSRRNLLGLTRSRSACVLVASRDGRPLGYAVLLTRRGARSARLY